MAMPALSAADAERVLRFIGDAESMGGDQPFTADLLGELANLVPAEHIVYDDLDYVQRRVLGVVGWPCTPGAPSSDEWDILTAEDPVTRRFQQGHVGALKISDFLSRKELHRSRLYDVLFHGCVEFTLDIAIHAKAGHTRTFGLARTGGRDFTERDRLVLNQLQPHLRRLEHAARTRRLLGTVLAELERAPEHDRRGVVLLSVVGEVEFVSPSARRMLHEFFPTTAGGRLPHPLADWLDRRQESFVRRRGDRRLVIQRSNGSVLMEEHDDAQLTAREREVLALVAQGKTNAEIAELLWLAPSTVRKHLENVYAKLGVSTRTAAVARFFGLSEAS